MGGINIKTIKTPKGIHNRRPYEPWNDYGDKDERKYNRKLFKAVRHKLLFQIPLSDEEEEYRKKYDITPNLKMSFEGTPQWMYKSWKQIQMEYRKKLK